MIEPARSTFHAPPGVSFRPPAGPADAEALRAVHDARAARDGLDPNDTYDHWPTVEALRAALVRDAGEVAAAQATAAQGSAMPGPRDRWCIVEAGRGSVAGYGTVRDWRELDGTHAYLCQGWVVPAMRGRGIGTALLAWGEALARRLARGDPSGRLEFGGNASETERDAAALLCDAGYRVAFHEIGLTLDPAALPSSPPLPAGVAVRPVERHQIARIAASVNAAWKGEPVCADEPAGRYSADDDGESWAAELAGPEHDPALWRIAWADGQPVGHVLVQRRTPAAGDSPAFAEVIEVSVHPAWRRRGIARALLVRAIEGVRAGGIDGVHVHTVLEFPTRAVDLYRSVGFRLAKTFPRYRKAPGGEGEEENSQDGKD